MNRLTVAVLATFVVILLGSGLLAYVFRDQGGTSVTTATPSGSPPGAESPAPAEREAGRGIPLLGELFGPDATGLSSSEDLASWEATSARIALRFALAAFLAALLAFRWRRGGSVV